MSPRTRGRTVSMAKIRKRAKYALREGRSRITKPAHHSMATNVYHCCVHKTGSQWIRHMLSDWRVYRQSGLRSFQYQSQLPDGFDARPISERTIEAPIPERSIVSPIYIGYENYLAIAKPESHRGFFIQRDPRDVVVSWYFSSRYSHPVIGRLGDVRQSLDQLPEQEGLRYAIDHLQAFGTFAALSSWAHADRSGSLEQEALVVRYEDLVGDENLAEFEQLFQHLDISITGDELRSLLSDHSFQKLSGRDRGEENRNELMRKGISGDWENHFDQGTARHFSEVTGELVTTLGYD